MGSVVISGATSGAITLGVAAYPSIGDQLDLLYKDMVAGKGDSTGEWFKAVKSVKDAHPKP